MFLVVKRRFIFFSILLLSSVCSLSQQYNYWYFGRKAGLNFNVSGGNMNPQVLSDGAMTTAEACASIADDNGNLLFYTNGVDVFDKNHQVMANGNNIGGNVSACQTAIVRVPGSNNYLIFTTDAFENDFLNGYRYTQVDMSSGSGNVVSKNIPLWSSCSERLVTVRHANGVYIWVITNDESSNTFRAWLVDCNGLQPSPVVSTVGDVMNQHALSNVGVLKANTDGNLISQTHFPAPGSFSTNFFQLFDFDNATGQLSNPKKIAFSDSKYNHCEFSPNSQFLYLTRKDDKQLDQIEVNLPTITDIQNSRISFPTLSSYYDIQLAPNGKIYLTQDNSQLAIINNPDLKGAACGFQRNVIDLMPGSANIGLPSHINDIVGSRNNGFDYSITNNCSGEVQFNGITTLGGTVSWFWEFGDGSTSTIQNPIHTFANPSQAYAVKLTVSSPTSCGNIVHSRIVLPGGFSKPVPDFSFVNVCDSGYVRFVNKTVTSQPGISFIWDFGDGNSSPDINPIHTYGSSGSFTVKLKTSTGTACLDDSISYDVSVNTLSINTIPDRVINLGETVVLNTTGPSDATYTWSPSTWLNDNSIQSPIAKPDENIVYVVTAINSENCKSVDSVKITVIQPEDIDDIYIPTAFTPNNDGKNDVIRPFLPRKYTLDEYSIFSRSGQRVFMTAERGVGWNGMIGGLAQNSDVFVWVLKATDPDGNKILRKGTLMLIR